jgi:hypothetical protein
MLFFSMNALSTSNRPTRISLIFIHVHALPIHILHPQYSQSLAHSCENNRGYTP